MSHSNEKTVCARANDLVDYLYGEADAKEAANFARHMGGCNECRTEFALMTNVRESMSRWRSEVLGFAWRAEPMAVGSKTSRKPHLSGLAALGEFFTISPLWLRGATAVGVALFCLLAALFVARMSAPLETLYTRAEVQAEVNAQVQRERARLSNESRPAPAAQVNSAGNEEVVRERTGSPILPASWTPTHPRPGVAKTARRSLSRAEREQLASDLRLKPTADEEDFTFLLEGGSN